MPDPRSCDLVASLVLFRTPAEEVDRCVAQVLSSTLATQVILIDNSVPPLDLSRINDRRVSIIATGKNLGYGRAHNRAFALSKGWSEFHLAMNTDIEYAPGTLEAMVDFMRDTPDAGLALPRVTYPDGRIQHLCRLLPTPADIFGRAFLPGTRWTERRVRRYEFHDWSYDRVASFPFLSGCFMMLRRSVVDAVGGFDDAIFLYTEDLDLSRRIHAVARTLFFPGATVTHEYRTQTARDWRRFRYRFVSFVRYFNKWGWFVDRGRDAINRAAIDALPR